MITMEYILDDTEATRNKCKYHLLDVPHQQRIFNKWYWSNRDEYFVRIIDKSSKISLLTKLKETYNYIGDVDEEIIINWFEKREHIRDARTPHAYSLKLYCSYALGMYYANKFKDPAELFDGIILILCAAKFGSDSCINILPIELVSYIAELYIYNIINSIV